MQFGDFHRFRHRYDVDCFPGGQEVSMLQDKVEEIGDTVDDGGWGLFKQCWR